MRTGSHDDLIALLFGQAIFAQHTALVLGTARCVLVAAARLGTLLLDQFVGGEVGYLIGHKGGPAVFERKESGLFSRKNVERTNAFFERYGGLTVVLARFVPIVRTFAPVAAGVGHMPWRRYSLYNLIGALLWGFGLTMFGYLIGFIPPVAWFVQNYIDLILLAVVGGTALVTLWHYFSERRKVRMEQAAGVPAESVEPLTDDSPA